MLLPYMVVMILLIVLQVIAWIIIFVLLVSYPGVLVKRCGVGWWWWWASAPVNKRGHNNS